MILQKKSIQLFFKFSQKFKPPINRLLCFRVYSYGLVPTETKWGWQRFCTENNKKTAYREFLQAVFYYTSQRITNRGGAPVNRRMSLRISPRGVPRPA